MKKKNGMRFYLSCWLLSLSTLLCAQKNYFQQEVNYKINVKLEDSLHLLIGMMEMEYINNSPDELPFLYIHLWANAYSSKTTAFAKQQLSQNKTKFHYASEVEMGGFSNLDFVANGKPLAWSLDNDHLDIAKLELSQPLRSGERIKITTPFTLKIPASFSRLGHVGTSYQITQWYPKPAVYDRKGWHPMPYLDMGEFYSEFGSFDVSITLPENYVVGATGTLQTKSEQAFLEARVAQTNAYHAGDAALFTKDDAFPTSSKRLKTLRYTAENVHDFAWFADKRFRVQKGEVQLSNNRKVDTWVMYTYQEENLWRNSLEYINRSVKFYSDKIGAYPYPHATAVQSALSAGGGMEYPMITVIDLAYSAKYLDVVITHEVGHNWFYGILASNERQHPWMDEGINSYYENQYTNLYYANGDMLTDFLPNFLTGNSKLTMEEFSYLTLARQNRDLPPNTPSAEMNYANYGVMAYLKPIIAFRHLEQYLGMNTFDRIMQSYFEAWKFKHPYPEDLKAHFEQESGKKLDWLFDDMLFDSKKLDYKLVTADRQGKNYQLTIQNKGDINAPFPVTGIKNGETVQTLWYEGFAAEKTFEFPADDYDAIVIDVERITIDLDRTNNRIRFVKNSETPIGIGFLFGLENEQQRKVYLAPSVAWNDYDKFMLGLAFHNRTLPSRNIEFMFNPMYAFGSNRLAGLGSLRYHLYPKTGIFNEISVQLNGRTFSYGSNERYGFENYFSKFAPQMVFKLRGKGITSPIEQLISLRHVSIHQDIGRGVNIETLEFTRFQQNYGINELQYQWRKKDILSPANAIATFQQGKGFSKLFAHFNQTLPYAQKDKALRLHAFGGTFFNYNAQTLVEQGVRPNFFLSGTTTAFFQKDYLFDQVMLGRSASKGFLSQQIFEQDAQFKTLTNVGSSSKWMLGFGLRSTLPGGIPIELFADGAVSRGTTQADFYYSAGLALPVFKDIIVVYLPILESEAIRENHATSGRDGVFKRLTFKINLRQLNPMDYNLVDAMSLQ